MSLANALTDRPLGSLFAGRVSAETMRANQLRSWTNEIQGIVMASEAQAILQLGATVPAKQAMIDYGVTQLYGGSVAAAAAAWSVQATTLAQLYATSPPPPTLKRCASITRTPCTSSFTRPSRRWTLITCISDSGLFRNTGPNPSDWLIAAANCDVLGYDRYAFNLMTDDLKALLAQVDKPTLIGEFSFPPTYNLVCGFGVYPSANAEDDAAAGRAYQQWGQEAAREPTTVGTMWFQYRDEPIAGRGPCPTGQPDAIVCGEHYAFGAADVTDRPKYDLILRMRDANLCAGPLRLSLTDPPVRRGLHGSGDVSGWSLDSRLRSRLSRLEDAVAKPQGALHTITRLVLGPVGRKSLQNATCRRTRGVDGTVLEFVRLGGHRQGPVLTEEELEQWISSVPIEPFHAEGSRW